MGEWALPPPHGVAGAACFAVSLVATIALATAITNLMHVALIWTLSGRGFNVLMMGLVTVFSGLVVPLPLFPDWLQPLLYWQPFRGLADVPYRIYSGHIDPHSAVFEILLQFAWTGVIVLGGYALMAYGKSRIVVQGG